MNLLTENLNNTIDKIPTNVLVTNSLVNITINLVARLLINQNTFFCLIQGSVISSTIGVIIGFTIAPIITKLIFPNSNSLKDLAWEIIDNFPTKEETNNIFTNLKTNLNYFVKLFC